MRRFLAMKHVLLALGLFAASGLGSVAEADPGFMLADLPTVIGAIDESLVTHVIWTHQNDIKKCYEDGLTRDPKIAGMMEIKFLIGEDGAVMNSEVRSSTLGDEEVEACILDSFFHMEFPVPRRGRPYVLGKFTFQPL